MFGFRNAFTRSLSTRALAATAGFAALGFMAPSAEADGWPWNRSRHSRVVVQPRIVIGGGSDYRHERHDTCDVVPADLKLSAYRSGGTVMLFVSGTNRTAGFNTALTECHSRGWNTEVTLRNAPRNGRDACADACTPFSLKAALHVRDNIKCLTVRVADRSFEVPVEEVQCLS